MGHSRKEGGAFIPDVNAWVSCAGFYDACWIWTASIDGGARGGIKYGKFFDGEKLVGAHIWAWESVNDNVPSGYIIMHKCDNPLCVNYLKCLKLGTYKENTEDMIIKRRHHGALTEEQISYIKSMKGKEPSRVVSSRMNTSPSNVQKIWNGKHKIY